MLAGYTALDSAILVSRTAYEATSGKASPAQGVHKLHTMLERPRGSGSGPMLAPTRWSNLTRPRSENGLGVLQLAFMDETIGLASSNSWPMESRILHHGSGPDLHTSSTCCHLHTEDTGETCNARLNISSSSQRDKAAHQILHRPSGLLRRYRLVGI